MSRAGPIAPEPTVEAAGRSGSTGREYTPVAMMMRREPAARRQLSPAAERFLVNVQQEVDLAGDQVLHCGGTTAIRHKRELRLDLFLKERDQETVTGRGDSR
jgi:hypothetical protein